MEEKHSYIRLVGDHNNLYIQKSWIKSLYNLFATIAPIIMLLYFNNLFLVPIMALLLIRLFIIFHDLAHSSYFPDKTLNYVTSIILGMILFTPYSHWITEHSKHHKVSNQLDVEEQYTQTAAWTVEKYKSSTFTSRLLYKLKYGYITLYTIVPYIFFLILQHVKGNMYENILHMFYVIFLKYYLHPSQYLFVIFSYCVAGVYGFLLFHIQHTFDGVYKEHSDKWDHFKNGMYGSSFFDIWWPLKFFTNGVEYHHIHHLLPAIPCYELQNCHEGGLKKDYSTMSKKCMLLICGTLCNIHYITKKPKSLKMCTITDYNI